MRTMRAWISAPWRRRGTRRAVEFGLDGLAVDLLANGHKTERSGFLGEIAGRALG